MHGQAMPCMAITHRRDARSFQPKMHDGEEEEYSSAIAGATVPPRVSSIRTCFWLCIDASMSPIFLSVFIVS